MSINVTSGNQFMSGSVPWLYMDDILYLGNQRESHMDMIKRVFAEELADELLWLDKPGVVFGRASLHLGEPRNYTIYKEDKIEFDTLQKIAKEFNGAEHV
jgi:hypothetical protein